ncbi:hypothetical protein B0H21DRAFT_28059, partial [Amylocystis lapponica]
FNHHWERDVAREFCIHSLHIRAATQTIFSHTSIYTSTLLCLTTSTPLGNNLPAGRVHRETLHLTMSDLPYLLSPDSTMRERVNTPPPSLRAPLLLGPYSYGNDSGTKFQVSPPRTPFGAIRMHHLAPHGTTEKQETYPTREKPSHNSEFLPLAQATDRRGYRSQIQESPTTSSAGRDRLRHARCTSTGSTLSTATEHARAQEKLNHEDRHKTFQAETSQELRGPRGSKAYKSILKATPDPALQTDSSKHGSLDSSHAGSASYSTPKDRRRSKTISEASMASHTRRATDNAVLAPFRTGSRDPQQLALRRQAIYRDTHASIPAAYAVISDDNMENKRPNPARSTMGSLTPSTTASSLGDRGIPTTGRQTKSVVLPSAKGPSALALRRRVVLADLDLNTLAAQIRPVRPPLRGRTHQSTPALVPAPAPCRPLHIVKRTDRDSLDALVRAALVAANSANRGRADATACHPVVRDLVQELDCAIESWRNMCL